MKNSGNFLSHLPKEETDFLAKRESIIVANRSLVYWLAKRFKVTDETYMELVQEGLYALCHAADNFDYGADSGFTAYAYHRIKSAMLRYLDDKHANSFINVYEMVKPNVGWTDDVEEANLLLNYDEKDIIRSFMVQKNTVARMGVLEKFCLISALFFSKLKLLTGRVFCKN